MTQNIYDKDEFFQGYSRLPRSTEGLDGAPEWPSLRAMLPKLNGLRVLDLGCGFGWFCRWAREQGAISVVGVDVSEKMLVRATSSTHDKAITYTRADMESLELSSGSFDLAYSSLAFHYLTNLQALIAQVHRSLVPGGKLIFSVEHPIFTAPSNPEWLVNTSGNKTWPVDSYLDEGPRATDWLAEGVVKQHRTIATYVSIVTQAGFTLTHLEEWAPTKEQAAANPEWADERQRPPFLLVGAIR
jgi:ubiquinone/menaquinone biosynthesis C-methylase UbiE